MKNPGCSITVYLLLDNLEKRMANCLSRPRYHAGTFGGSKGPARKLFARPGFSGSLSPGSQSSRQTCLTPNCPPCMIWGWITTSFSSSWNTFPGTGPENAYQTTRPVYPRGKRYHCSSRPAPGSVMHTAPGLVHLRCKNAEHAGHTGYAPQGHRFRNCACAFHHPSRGGKAM